MTPLALRDDRAQEWTVALLRLLPVGLMQIAVVFGLMQPPMALVAARAAAQSGAPMNVPFFQPAPALPGRPGEPPRVPPQAPPPASPPMAQPSAPPPPSGPQETRPATGRAKEALFDRLPEAQAIASLVRDKVQFVDAIYDLKEMVADPRPFDPAHKASIEQRMALREAALILRGRAEAQDQPIFAMFPCEPGDCHLAQYAAPMASPLTRIAAQAIFTIFLAHGARVMPWATGLLGVVLVAAILIAAARNCGGVVAVIGGRCSAAASRPGNGMRPPGDCRPDQLDGYQSMVNDRCRGLPGCRATGETWESINRKIGNFSRCIDARRVVNDRCFRGGDDGHIEAIENVQRAIRNCQDVTP